MLAEDRYFPSTGQFNLKNYEKKIPDRMKSDEKTFNFRCMRIYTF